MKETIVFVHGMCHGAWCWEEYFIPYFEQLGYHCIAINLPGHKNKGWTKSISYSIGDYVQELRQTVEELAELPIIIGHSMGGMILQKYLKTQSCKNAILMSSVPPAGVLKASLRVIFKHPGALPFLFQRNLLGVFRKYPHLMFNDIGIATRFAPFMCSESFVAYLALLIPIFHHISTPLLLLGGSNDELITVREFQQTAKHYKAELEIIEGGSHDLMLDANCEKTAKLIHHWINK